MTQLPQVETALRYVRSRLAPRRRKTRVVRVGDVPVGGDEPIRVQSMTTTATRDADATVEQIAQLQAAGCEIVRVTVPTLKDAQALPEIRAKMAERGLTVPLVADVHFSPKLAMLAVEHVDKVRINPGNFTDSKRFAAPDATDAEFAAELERIEERFTPLVLRAKARGVSLRIGTNHGSLSDRIMSRYGDSPEGMVESVLEFVRICEGHDYHDLIISMKSSNTQVMVQAYRLIAARMSAEGMDYPLHLGVTEAGDGDDARIKSAIGIGALLQDGIGDTIRVSLTETPVAEVPVASELARRAGPRLAVVPEARGAFEAERGAFAFLRRATRRVQQGPAVAAIGGDEPLRVELGFGRPAGQDGSGLAETLARLSGPGAGDRRLEVAAFDLQDAADLDALVLLRSRVASAGTQVGLAARVAPSLWAGERRSRLLEAADRIEAVGLGAVDVADLAAAVATSGQTSLLLCGDASASPEHEGAALADLAQAAQDAGLDRISVAVRRPPTSRPPVTAWIRGLVRALGERNLDLPLILRDEGDLLSAATDLGGALVDGLGDAIRLDGFQTPERALDVAYGILQGARRRTTRTEYISCPGCGRTLFDLEPVTARIKQQTAHLKGLKIAVMGCVVNGPGEMADADFGYVGWKVGKVNLYVGRECVVRDVPEDEAPGRLVDLIKESGRWTEPAPAGV